MVNQVVATWTEIVATAPTSFLLGAAVGFLLSNRFKLIRRNGKDTP